MPKVVHVAVQALSFDARCIGFQWLVRIIHGTLTQLGYKSPHLPPLLQVGHHEITNIGFIGQGRKAEGSFVYRVDCGDEQAILKLNHTDREVISTIHLKLLSSRIFKFTCTLLCLPCKCTLFRLFCAQNIGRAISQISYKL